ncbi:MAG TPA: hypothetical protein VIY49_22120 [Bryobacteraceae bacterium]
MPLWPKAIPCLIAMLPAIPCAGATFGTVVPIRGTVSDIALDSLRGQVYAANFSASRIEVMSTYNLTLLAPLGVPLPPSCVAMSPDNRFLVVGENAAPFAANGGFTIFDLDMGERQDVTMSGSALAVAFGAGSEALMVTTTGVFLVNPLTAKTTPVTATMPLPVSLNLPVPLATFPPQIIQAAAGVSGDGNTIVVLATAQAPAQGTASATAQATSIYLLLRYSIPTGALGVEAFQTSPPLGPYAVAVDGDATNVLAGWGLLHRLNQQDYGWAEFPNGTGAANIGTNAWDLGRNVIYAQQVVNGDGPVLHVVDTDNLTVRERIQLPENLAGHSLISSDDQTMYAVSVSGITVLPIGKLSKTAQIATQEEDLMFQGDACSRAVITQTLDILDLGNAGADFTLSVPQGTTGVKILTPSGVAPASVQIQVDPVAFQNAYGTTTIPLTIASSKGVNLPFPVRLLINTRNSNQLGTVVNVPGKLVDMMADPSRNRVYIIRQDKNLVLVYNSTTLQPITSLRTGNTPVKMSMTTDQHYLIVGNDNSMIASVFDLDALQPAAPILFPFGHYPRTIGVSLTGIFATARVVGSLPACLQSSTGGTSGTGGTGGTGSTTGTPLDQIDFANGVANTPCNLGIYRNNLTSANGALAESPGNLSLLLALPDGNVMLYDYSVATWVDSRKDFSALGGAYGAFSNNLFLADINLLDAALVPIGQFPAATGSSSGMGIATGAGLRTTAQAASGPGLIERVDMGAFSTYHGSALTEAPLLPASLPTAAVGLIGETILPFIRTLAMPADQSSILLLTVSGITQLTPNFDAITQIPSISSVTNAADGTASVAPGGLVNIVGAGLAPAGAWATSLPLPFALGDVCVTVGSTALALFSVSPSSISGQLPFVPPGAGTVTVTGPGGVSSGYDLTILAQAPAVFLNGSAGTQTGLATVIRDDNQELVDFTNPIHPNLGITIYLTGMGTTTPPPALGAAAPLDPLALVDAPPTVTLGGVGLAVNFAGLTPGEVGVYQINAQVPANVQGGTSVPLAITQGGSSTSLSVRVVTP